MTDEPEELAEDLDASATGTEPAGATETSSVDRVGGRRAIPLGRVATVAAAVILVICAVVIALEQRQQTTQLERQACYERAAALAQVAAVEVAKASGQEPEAALVILDCDKRTGFEP